MTSPTNKLKQYIFTGSQFYRKMKGKLHCMKMKIIRSSHMVKLCSSGTARTEFGTAQPRFIFIIPWPLSQVLRYWVYLSTIPATVSQGSMMLFIRHIFCVLVVSSQSTQICSSFFYIRIEISQQLAV